MLNALPLRAPRGHPSAILLNVQEKMSALSAFTPPPLSITIRRETSCLRLRRPSLAAGGQGVQRGLARPDACTTDIVPHSCTGVRPGLSQRASQNGGEFLATSGELRWDLQPATLDNPKSGMHPSHRGCSSKWGRVWGVSLASDTGCGRDARVPRGMSPNLDHTPLTGRIPDHWGDLPDHWRLRPGRSVWPHLTDSQLACTHNNPGYTSSGAFPTATP